MHYQIYRTLGSPRDNIIAVLAWRTWQTNTIFPACHLALMIDSGPGNVLRRREVSSH